MLGPKFLLCNVTYKYVHVYKYTSSVTNYNLLSLFNVTCVYVTISEKYNKSKPRVLEHSSNRYISNIFLRQVREHCGIGYGKTHTASVLENLL